MIARVALAFALTVLAQTVRADPAPPYYSIQLSTNSSVAHASFTLKKVRDLPGARIERRGKYFTVRAGAWASHAEASEVLQDVRKRGYKDAAVMRVTKAVTWIDPSPLDTTTPAAPPSPPKTVQAAPPAAPEPTAPAPVAAITPPTAATSPPPLPKSLEIPPEEYDFRAASHGLDWQVRNLINTKGLTRRDGFLYTLDVAWLLRYAAQRSDQAFYEKIRSAVKPLIVDNKQDPFSRGFVLWRHRSGVDPEITGAAEAIHLARALWEGAKEFNLPRDRELALMIIGGYQQHAYEFGDDWLVRKYFGFGNKIFANLSVIGGYLPDFLAEVEASIKPDAGGPTLAERSYGVIERAVHEKTGLMYPLVQPEVNQTYPGMDLEVYAPNNVLPVADSCDAAEAVVRKLPDIGEELLEFFHDTDRRDRTGYPYAYFDASSRKRLRRQVVGSPTIACLARLAVALDDDEVRDWLFPIVQAEIESLAAVPALQEAPLYGAGPLLMAAEALGGFRR